MGQPVGDGCDTCGGLELVVLEMVEKSEAGNNLPGLTGLQHLPTAHLE